MIIITFVAACILFLGIFFWPRRLIIQRVVDGDSLEAIYRGRPTRIRISGYDAPEYRQPGGRDARTALAKMVEQHSVWIVGGQIDHYGRHIGPCFAGWMPVSWRMIAAGYGWPEGKVGMLISLPARIRKIGLWHNPNHMHPSKWRLLNPSRHPNSLN